MDELSKLADEVEGTTRRLTTRRMDQVVAKSPEWLWPGRIPIGTLTLFVGHPGVGKSTWACHVAARLSRGELGPPADTVIATVEDSAEYTIAPRLEAARADRSRIHLVYPEAQAALGGVSLPGDINELRDLVLERKARWIVIDPLPAQLSQEYDSYKDQGVRGALAPLVQMAEDTHSAIAGIVHFNKNEGATMLARIGGSVAWAAAPRSILAFVEDPDDETQRIVVHEKSSMGPKQPPLRYTVEQASIVEDGEQVATSRIVEGDEDHDLDTSMILQRRDRTSPQREKAAGLITAYLASGPQQWKAVAAILKAADISEHTGRRAREELKTDGVIGHSRDGTIGPHVWHLLAHEVRPRGQMGKKEGSKGFDGRMYPLAHLPTEGQGVGKSDPLTEATDNVQAAFPDAEVIGNTT